MAAKFYIYRNLHCNKFSGRLRGKVIDRRHEFVATDVQFKVNQSGRDRVVIEKKKNVHAFCVTDKYYLQSRSTAGLKVITYNPYVAEYFTCDGKKIDSAQEVFFKDNKCYLIS